MYNISPAILFAPKIYSAESSDSTLQMLSTEACSIPKIEIYGNKKENTVSIPGFENLADDIVANTNGIDLAVRDSKVLFEITNKTVSCNEGSYYTNIPSNYKYKQGYLHILNVFFTIDPTTTTTPAIGIGLGKTNSYNFDMAYSLPLINGPYTQEIENGIYYFSAIWGSYKNQALLDAYPYLAFRLRKTPDKVGIAKVNFLKIQLLEVGSGPKESSRSFDNSYSEKVVHIPKSINKNGLEIPLLFGKKMDLNGTYYSDCLEIDGNRKKVFYKSYVNRYCFNENTVVKSSAVSGNSLSVVFELTEDYQFYLPGEITCNFAVMDGYQGTPKEYPTLEYWTYSSAEPLKAQVHLNTGTSITNSKYNSIDSLKNLFKTKYENGTPLYIEFLRCSKDNPVEISPLIIDCTEFDWAQELLNLKQTRVSTDIFVRNANTPQKIKVNYLKYR